MPSVDCGQLTVAIGHGASGNAISSRLDHKLVVAGFRRAGLQAGDDLALARFTCLADDDGG